MKTDKSKTSKKLIQKTKKTKKIQDKIYNMLSKSNLSVSDQYTAIIAAIDELPRLDPDTGRLNDVFISHSIVGDQKICRRQPDGTYICYCKVDGGWQPC